MKTQKRKSRYNSKIDAEVKAIEYWQLKIYRDFGLEIPLFSCVSSHELKKLYYELQEEKEEKEQ